MQKQQYFLTAFKENFGSQDGTSTEELASIKVSRARPQKHCITNPLHRLYRNASQR